MKLPLNYTLSKDASKQMKTTRFHTPSKIFIYNLPVHTIPRPLTVSNCLCIHKLPLSHSQVKRLGIKLTKKNFGNRTVHPKQLEDGCSVVGDLNALVARSLAHQSLSWADRTDKEFYADIR